MSMKKPMIKSKGPGRVKDGLDATQHRLYCMAEHCRYAQHARECLQAAKDGVGDLADKLRALARHWGKQARAMYAEAMESGVAA